MIRLTIFACVLFGALGAYAQDTATTVFSARTIVTMDPETPSAAYVAVTGDEIVAVGDTLADIESALEGDTYVLNDQFTDHVLMPGFIDPHLHPIMAAVLLPMEFITPEGWQLPRGDSPPARKPADYRQRLRDAIAAHTSDQPFLTWGYHQLWHGDLHRAGLDSMESEKPVIVWHRSFHEIICNSAALAYLGFDSQAAFDEAVAAQHEIDPSHADYERGHISETALAIALPRLSRVILSPEHLGQGFQSQRQMIREAGVTTIADMATGLFANFAMEASMIRNAYEPDASARVLLVPAGNILVRDHGTAEKAVEAIKRFESRDYGPHVFMNRRVKLFADGAFFSQYMRMNPPGYTDGHEGKWLTEPDALAAMARVYWDAGLGIHCHVNGDEGVDVVLDTLESMVTANPRNDHRFTLEHFGYASKEQVARVKELGAYVSAQPNYVYVLSDMYSAHGLGPERATQMVRLGSLERHGVRTALHSDLTMAPVAPLFLAEVAATRVNMEGDTVAPDERLSLDAALRAVTIDAAHVLGLEDAIGSITPGKKADFAVLSENPYDTGAAGLGDIDVWGVVYQGQPIAAK